MIGNTLDGSDTLRILRVASDTYPQVSGGLGLHVDHLSRAQSERGHEVLVLAADRTDDGAPRTETRSGYEIRFHREVCSPLDNSICPTLARSLYRLADEFDVVHAHSHLFFSTNVAAVVRQITETPLVVTNHGVYSQTAPMWLQHVYFPTIGQLTLRAADRVICYTETDRRRLSELGFDGSTRVVHNGIDCSTFRPLPDVDETDQILYVGRLKRAKGVETLLQAFSRLEESDPGIRLKIVGDGPDRQRLERLATEEGVGDAVSFTGRLPNDQLPRIYNESALFALPSRNEGFPRTVMEALACETPVVSTALPQLESILSDGGVTVPALSVSSLTRAIGTLLADDERRRLMGRRGRERVVDGYSWSETVTQTLDEYYDLVDAPARQVAVQRPSTQSTTDE